MISRTFSTPIDFVALARRFHAPGVRAIALMGSHARGDAGRFSDVDLLRMIDADVDVPGVGSHLIAGRLVTVGNAAPDEVERWFTDPAEVVKVVAGLRVGQALVDDENFFAEVRARAHTFTWTPALQAAANAYAGEQMVGWIEEAHKGLEGLRRHDVGRLLNARFGLSWGLSHVMQVQRGILVHGDNSFFAEMTQAMGAESRWSHLYRQAFGIDGGNLRSQVTAGLQLYCECARLLDGSLPAHAGALVAETAQRITHELARQESST